MALNRSVFNPTNHAISQYNPSLICPQLKKRLTRTTAQLPPPPVPFASRTIFSFSFSHAVRLPSPPLAARASLSRPSPPPAAAPFAASRSRALHRRSHRRSHGSRHQGRGVAAAGCRLPSHGSRPAAPFATSHGYSRMRSRSCRRRQAWRGRSLLAPIYLALAARVPAVLWSCSQAPHLPLRRDEPHPPRVFATIGERRGTEPERDGSVLAFRSLSQFDLYSSNVC